MKVGILGYSGRVGKILVDELSSDLWSPMVYAGGADTKEGAENIFSEADVLIDFTIPEATHHHIYLAEQTHKALVIGTTGLTETIEKDLRMAAQKAPILYTANMSIGVNLIVSLVEQAAQKLGTDWDIEIFETHHHMKIDSPSGTALALGKAARAGRGGGEFVTDRTGKRKTGDIGYAVQRGGDVVGEHTVTFFGKGERIEIGHKATDRALFARGALKAAQWLGGQPPGLYSMKSVLGL